MTLLILVLTFLGLTLVRVAEAQLNLFGGVFIDSETIGDPLHLDEVHAGSSLAVGDFDGDGEADLVVGVPGRWILSRPGAGGFAVFRAFGTDGWFSKRRFSQSGSNIDGDPEEGDRFASSLAVGDFNHDGYDDLAIGVPNEDVGAVADAGAIHVIYGSSVGLDPEHEELFTRELAVGGEIEAGAQFGYSLTTGDFDLDGYDDLAIGAPFETVLEAPGAGVVVAAYGGPGGISSSGAQWWSQWQLGAINLEDTSEFDDFFGSSLTTGDFDGDGYDDLAVGAPGEGDSQTRTGGINIIYGGTIGLHNSDNQFTALLEADQQFGQKCGSAIAAGDFNQDGVDDLAVGCPRSDSMVAGVTQTDSGRVILLQGHLGTGLSFDNPADFLTVRQPIDALNTVESSDRFGSTLVAGDFDADGYADLAVAATGESINGSVLAGSVNILFGDPSMIAARTQWFHQETPGIVGVAEVGDEFGTALAAGIFEGSSSDLVIGIPFEDLAGHPDTGGVQALFSTGIVFADGFESGDFSAWNADLGSLPE